MEKLNLKSQGGHVEVILSFTLFIGFLLFLFIFMNPFAKTKEPSYVMKNIQDSVIKEISSEVGKMSVIVNTDDGCYIISNQIKEDYGNIYIETHPDLKKYLIYFSDEFDSTSNPNEDSGCSTGYALGVYSKENMIIYEKIIDLKTEYGDYNALKRKLGIINDFSFSIHDLDGNLINELSVNKNPPKGVDVSVKEIPLRVFKISDRSILELVLKISSWE